MAVRMTQVWRALSAVEVGRIAAHMGVYQLGDDDGNVLLIGAAGGASRYGLRGALDAHLAAAPDGVSHFRVEVTTAYHSRLRELLQVHVHDHGGLPPGNADLDPASLGRLRPA